MKQTPKKKSAGKYWRIKDIRFNISLYIIIPVIIAGIALLATIAAYNITSYYMKRDLSPDWPVAFWGSIMVFVTAIFGLLIVKFIIDPVRRFARNTENLNVISGSTVGVTTQHGGGDEMTRFTRLFDQVTEILSRVEAETLFPEIVGQSVAMRGVLKQILQVAKTDATVLILGETGTGKELIARSIHRHSRRKDRPFNALNCAAIPDALLESELFGHEKGAFTGANARKLGKFEIADKSTLFMDEIGDMPLETQAKVLRAVQEGRFERVGGVEPVTVDVRFIAATNQDLARLVEQGRFRQDLYFRLNVFTIVLPPLRDRREDIPLLAERFMDRCEKSCRLSTESQQLLTAYDWPGNVRELENAIEAATVLAEDVVETRHLPAAVTHMLGVPLEKTISELPREDNLDHRLQEMEKSIIIDALKRSHGVQKKAARLLGIKEHSLWHRVKKYDIDVTSFKHEKL